MSLSDLSDRAYDLAFETEVKVVRHVRTAAGARRYGEPIGSVIVGNRRLHNIRIGTSVYDGWTVVHGTNGKTYSVGKDDESGKWIATPGTEGWAAVATGNSEDDVYAKLDGLAGPGGKRKSSATASIDTGLADGKRIKLTNEELGEANNLTPGQWKEYADARRGGKTHQEAMDSAGVPSKIKKGKSSSAGGTAGVPGNSGSDVVGKPGPAVPKAGRSTATGRAARTAGRTGTTGKPGKAKPNAAAPKFTATVDKNGKAIDPQHVDAVAGQVQSIVNEYLAALKNGNTVRPGPRLKKAEVAWNNLKDHNKVQVHPLGSSFTITDSNGVPHTYKRKPDGTWEKVVETVQNARQRAQALVTRSATRNRNKT